MQPAPLSTRATLSIPSLARAGLAIIAGSAALAASAHVSLPFWPVPLSMQTFVVLAIGLACGGRLAAGTVLAYLAEGAAGLPVFQGGAGLAYLMGPTGGFLLGFVPAAYAVGTLSSLVQGRMRWAGVLLLGLMLIYAPGLAWLSVLFGASKAVAFGLVPFLPAEACKLALAVAIAPQLRRLR